MSTKLTYLDYSATTPVGPETLKVMQKYFSNEFGNASSKHKKGHFAQQALTKARAQVAHVLGCTSREIVFTSGGTESNNLALKGVAEKNNYKGHIITSSIEHHSVLDVVRYLKNKGVEVTVVDVDKNGMVDVGDIVNSIKSNTFLVSIMYANNEIGTIQNIREIGNIVQKKGILMHTDAVQAPGLLDININKLHVDLFSLSGHKFYGPKGIGVLYVSKNVKLVPQLHGGGQEFGLRSSTENISSIIGLSEALYLADKSRIKETRRLSNIRDWLIGSIIKEIPNAVLTGHKLERLANNVSFCFPRVSGESLVMRLSELGYECSSGSACTTGSIGVSHVLVACGINEQTSRGSLRISLGNKTTKKALIPFISILAKEFKKAL